MPHDLRFDVSSALPQQVAQGAPQWIAAWLFMPPHIDPEQRQTVLVCLHGGSYDKRYYHLEVPGCTDYSMAAHLAEQGNIVLVFDWLGERDVSPAVEHESACYASASHLTFLLLSQSGHCHNFSSRRRDLWERIHQWAALDRLPDCRLEHCA